MDHIILEGFVGCGKGAVGKKVAKDLDLPFIEVDKLVSDKLKMTPADIYDRFGEEYFRALETVVLSELKEREGRCVIILGSGLPLYEHNDPYLEDLGRVYWLKLSKEQLVQKIKKSKKHDWLRDEDSNVRIGEILKEREAAYDRVASETIEADGMSVNEAAQAVIDLASEDPKASKKAEEKPAKKPAAKKKAAPKKKAADKAAEEPAAEPPEEKAAEPAEAPAAEPVKDETPAEEPPKEKKAAPKKKTAAKKATGTKTANTKTADTKTAAKKTTAKKTASKAKKADS